MRDIADALRRCAEVDIPPHSSVLEEAADEINRLRQELACAEKTLEEERARAHEAIRDMRTNPLDALYGNFCFVGLTNELYVATVRNKQLELVKREGRIDYLLRQISFEEYAKRVKDQV